MVQRVPVLSRSNPAGQNRSGENKRKAARDRPPRAGMTVASHRYRPSRGLPDLRRAFAREAGTGVVSAQPVHAFPGHGAGARSSARWLLATCTAARSLRDER